MTDRPTTIPGFLGFGITKDGVVWDLLAVRIKPVSNVSAGRPAVTIHGERVPISRLLALAFIPNPYNLPLVRHLDDIATNNSLDNLAWGTYQDNANDRMQNGMGAKGSAHGRAKLTEANIPIIRLLHANGECTRDVAAKFNVSKCAIECVNNGRTWSHVK